MKTLEFKAVARDEQFIRTLAQIDVRRHFYGLIPLIAKKFPESIPVERFVFQMDYSAMPPTLDCIGLDDLTDVLKEVNFQGFADAPLAQLSRVDSLLLSGRKLSSFQIVLYMRGDQIKTLTFDGELTFTEKFGAKLRPGAKDPEGPKRASVRDCEGNPIEVSYDEIDDMIRRRLLSVSADRHPWDRRYALQDKVPDWPFVHGTSVLFGREFAPT